MNVAPHGGERVECRTRAARGGAPHGLERISRSWLATTASCSALSATFNGFSYEPCDIRVVLVVGPWGYKYRSDIATACSATHSRSGGGPTTSTNVP